MDFDTFPAGKTINCPHCGNETYQRSKQEEIYSHLLPGARKACRSAGVEFDAPAFSTLVASSAFQNMVDLDDYQGMTEAILSSCRK